MTNVTRDPQRSAQLAAARNAYDAELAAMHAMGIKGHGYEPYPVLFDRTSTWTTKEPLLKLFKGGDDEDAPAEPKANKKNERKRTKVAT